MDALNLLNKFNQNQPWGNLDFRHLKAGDMKKLTKKWRNLDILDYMQISVLNLSYGCPERIKQIQQKSTVGKPGF